MVSLVGSIIKRDRREIYGPAEGKEKSWRGEKIGGWLEETRIKTISNNFTRSDFGGAASRRRTRGEKERRKRERQRGGRIVNKKAIVLLSGIRPRGASEWRGGEQQPLSRKGPHRLSRKNGSRMTAPLFERWNGTCVRPSLTGKNGPRERASRALLPFPARVARETGHKGADLNGGYLVLRSLNSSSRVISRIYARLNYLSIDCLDETRNLFLLHLARKNS